MYLYLNIIHKLFMLVDYYNVPTNIKYIDDQIVNNQFSVFQLINNPFETILKFYNYMYLIKFLF